MIRKPKSIHDYWVILLRRKWSFLAPFVLILTVSCMLAYTLPDIYRSTTLIFVEPQKIPESFVKPTVTTKIEDRLKTITQQILSRTRLEKIIQQFQLYQNTGQRSSFEMFLAQVPVLNSYWNFTALEMSAAIERMRKDIEVNVKGDNVFTISYQGADPEVTMQVTNKLASLFIEENLKAREQQAEGTSQFLENELNNSRLLLEQQEKQIKEFKQRYMGELPEQLETNLRALDRFQLELKSTVEALKAAEERKESIEKILASAKAQTPSGDGVLLARLEQLKAHLSNLQAEYKEDYPDIAITRKEIKEIEEVLAAKERFSGAEKGQETASIPRDPFTQNLATQLREVNLEISTLKTRWANLTKQIELFERRVENTPAREQQLMTIMRDYENLQRNYQSLLAKRLEAKISENLEKRQQGEIFRILDPANYPTVPYKPNRWLIVIMGILIAAGSGFGLAYLREQMDQSFLSEEDLVEVVRIPVLASVPYQPLLSKLAKRNQSLRSRHAIPRNYPKADAHLNLLQNKPLPTFPQYLLNVLDPTSVLAEQFRILYARLEQVHRSKGSKVFCISSAVKGEGKTFTAVNLAMTLSRDYGKRTLLMDVDCKGMMLQKLAGLEGEEKRGWVDLIFNRDGWDQAVTPYSNDKLFLLLTGKVTHSSSSLIASLGSSGLLQELRKEFDYILMDAPPILPLADMSVLENLVDGILLVVRAEETNRTLEVKASSSLSREKIVGLVLNGVKRELSHYYYYNGSDGFKGGKV